MGEPRFAWDSLDEISVDFEDHSGHPVCRQLGRVVLERAPSYALVMFLFEKRRGQEWVRRVALHRYRKLGGGWRKHSAVAMAPGSVELAAAFLHKSG